MTGPQDIIARLLQRHSREFPEDALEAVADSVGPIPPTGGLARLEGMMRAEPFAPFERGMADLLATPIAAARQILKLPLNASAWVDLLPGCQLMHIPDMEHHDTADIGFVSVADGVTFPLHKHGGGERGLVIRGTIIDDDGTRYEPGDSWTHGPGTAHTFRAEGDLLYAVVVYDVSFPGSELAVPEGG